MKSKNSVTTSVSSGYRDKRWAIPNPDVTQQKSAEFLDKLTISFRGKKIRIKEWLKNPTCDGHELEFYHTVMDHISQLAKSDKLAPDKHAWDAIAVQINYMSATSLKFEMPAHARKFMSKIDEAYRKCFVKKLPQPIKSYQRMRATDVIIQAFHFDDPIRSSWIDFAIRSIHFYGLNSAKFSKKQIATIKRSSKRPKHPQQFVLNKIENGEIFETYTSRQYFLDKKREHLLEAQAEKHFCIPLPLTFETGVSRKPLTDCLINIFGLSARDAEAIAQTAQTHNLLNYRTPVTGHVNPSMVLNCNL